MINNTLLTQNHMLASLPSTDRERLMPDLQSVTLRLGEVLYESGTVLRHLYLPTTSVVSLLFVTETGASTELAVGEGRLRGYRPFHGG